MRMNEPIAEKEYDENIYHPDNLNAKQTIAFNFVRKWIDAIERALAEAENQGPDYELLLVPPFRLQIQGKGGTGKSFWLHCVAAYIQQYCKNKNLLKIMAPTGTAAFSINGTTLHSELKIPINYSKEKVCNLYQ